MVYNFFVPVHTIGIMSLCTLLYGVLQRRVPDPTLRIACVGLAFGAGAITVMLQPLSFGLGFQEDARVAFVVMAAVFGGPVATAVTVTMAIAARVAIGGEGALTGCLVIVAAAGGAGAWQHFYGERLKKQCSAWIYICVISTASVAFTLMISTSAGAQPVLCSAIITATTIFIFGKMLESEQRREGREHKLLMAASTDVLTGLPNRRAFEQYAKQLEISNAKDILLLLLDVDHFKSVNDQYGHEEGDAVLRKIGAAINNTIRESDFAARIGGEEFAIILRAKSGEAGLEVAERFRGSLQVPFGSEVNKLKTRVSIGGFYVDGQPFDYSTAYRLADAALYRSKFEGRNRSTLYHTDNCEISASSRVGSTPSAQVSLSSLSAA